MLDWWIGEWAVSHLNCVFTIVNMYFYREHVGKTPIVLQYVINTTPLIHCKEHVLVLYTALGEHALSDLLHLKSA